VEQSFGNTSYSILGLLHRNPENNGKMVCQFSCCAVRNSIVTTAQINSVFLVTVFPKFKCDIPFSVSDANK